MSKLYSHETKQWLDVPDDQVDDLVRGGKHTFETGIEIPVVAPDGALTFIKSDDAHDAFKEGYRWQNQLDRDTDYEIQQQRIRQENFDKDALAFGLGAMRGLTLGGSDVIADAVVPGYDDAAKTLKDVNPVSSGLGSATGAIASMALSGGASTLGAVGRGGKAATSAAESLMPALGAGRAARAIETLGKTTLGSIAEGAYYGLGEGISEAALGKPEDVVNSLAAGVGLGALVGGAFGGVIGTGKAGAPYLKQAFNWGTDALGDAATKAARGVERKGITAALSREGQERLISDFGEMQGSPQWPALREMALNGEWDKAKQLVAETKKATKVFEREQRDLRRGIDTFLKNAAEDEALALKGALDDAGGNAWAALPKVYKQIQEKSNQFKESVVQYTDLADPTRVASVTQAIDDASAALAKIGTPEATTWSKTLADYNFRNLIKAGSITEAEEFIALNHLKRDVLDWTQIRRMPDGRVREQLSNVWKLAKNTLADPASTIRPEIKAFSQSLDADYTAYNTLKDLLGKKTLKSSALGRLAADPAKLDAAEPLFTSYSQFASDFQALKQAANNKGAREKALDAIKSKIRDMKMRSVNGDLSNDDLYEIISEAGFIKGNPLAKMQKLKEVERYLRGSESLSPLDKAVFLERQLKGGPSQLEKYVPYQKQLEVLDQVRGVPGRDIGFLAERADRAGAAAGFFLGGAPGAGVGGAIGTAIGAVSKFQNASPAKIMQGIARVERSVQTGVQRIQKAAASAVDALTSGKFRSALNVGGVALSRERFKEISENIREMSNPQRMMDILADMPAEAVPQVHQALAAKLSLATGYLAQHLPQDPLAGTSIFPDKTAWVPSDYQLGQFQRRVAVVNDPSVAVDKIAQGFITPEEVDALKNVYPEIYQGLQEQLISGIMEANKQPPYRSRLLAQQVFGIPTDYSMTPKFVQSMQQRWAPVDQGGRPEGSGAAPGKAQKSIDIKPMETIATETDAVTFKTEIR